MNSFFIGIDPGLSGGVSIYNFTKKEFFYNNRMPSTGRDLYNLLAPFNTNKNKNINVHAVLEKVHAMPGQGVTSMFTFGENFGTIKMALIACHIPFTMVTPQKWQKFYSLGTKGQQTTTQWKNKLKDKAQQLFPNTKIFLYNADSTLICYWGLQNNLL